MTLSLITPDWPAPAGVRAASTERVGGFSDGPYAGLNLGLHVGDDPAAVVRNRDVLNAMLSLSAEPAWLEQIHATDIADLDAGASRRADGAVTSEEGVACVIMTADCLPVLLTTANGSRVGAAHAGWRGLARGVLPRVVEAMGGAPSDLLAWLGPAIGPAAYEVGTEVREEFVVADPAAEACFAANDRGRWQADLYGLARLSLAAAGVERVFGGNFCTATEADRFFSHRREAPCGRMATLIWRAPH